MMVSERSTIVEFLSQWWAWILAFLCVVLALLFGLVIQFTPATVVPVLGLFVGIAWGAFVPYAEAALEYTKETGQLLKWDHKYTLAPMGTLALGILGFSAVFLFIPGAFGEMTGMSFVSAAAFGRAGKETWSDGRKLMAVLK